MQDFGNVSDYNNAKPSTNPVVGATSGVQDFGNVSDYGSGYTAGSSGMGGNYSQPDSSVSDGLWSRLVDYGKDVGSMAKSAVGGVASGVAGPILTAEDMAGRAIVNKFGTEEMKQNLANSPTLNQQWKTQMGGDENPNTYGAGQLAGNAALMATPIGEGGALAGGVVGATGKALGLGKGATNLAAQATKGAVEGGTAAAAYGLDNGEPDSLEGYWNDVMGGAAIGGALPLAGAGISKALRAVDLPEKIINGLLGPSTKLFSYGKNPGKSVAELGVTGKNMEDLTQNIWAKRDEIGKGLSDTIKAAMKKGAGTIATGSELAPLTHAIEEAKKAPNINATLITRLEGAKEDLEGLFNKVAGESKGVKNATEIANQLIGRKDFIKSEDIAANNRKLNPEDAITDLDKAQEFKQTIGKLTKWTGNGSDDAVVNKALKQVYGGIRGKMEASMEKVMTKEEFAAYKKANEHYANLTSAGSAAEHRQAVQLSKGIGDFSDSVVAGGGALLGGVPGAVIGYIGKKATEDPWVASHIASILSKSTPEEVQSLRGYIKTLIAGKK